MNKPNSQTDRQEAGFSETEIGFIQTNLKENPGQLILRAGQFKELDVKKLAAQILSRQKAVKKLPEWSANERLIFPPALSVEQCSSEATARYKASLVSGKQLMDVTGGMGVDCFYMSRKFDHALYFEQQEEVAKTAEYNFKQLGCNNITVHNADSIQAIENKKVPSDWIYADPARRNTNREKVVLLSDCTPDITASLPVLFENAPNILLKTSPLLDIDLASRELENLAEVHVIGYEQECKELLFVLKKDCKTENFTIKTRIINAAGEVLHQLDFDRESERNAPVSYSNPLRYLYEPHPAVLKAGAFRTLCAEFDTRKLAVNSQLYTSENYIPDFPGRPFKIVAVCKPDMREISGYIQSGKANLTIRNFPGKTEELRKKWKLKEGGDFYLFATTLTDNAKVVIVTTKP
ncbi:class I SAM-dependent methyltransferase [Dyadobacter sediminis]|uniref:Uncharacterized protein n=1 Tax=Dyadobacter sediminis TaxID=1493691 RepID=A0A5R9KAP3_9BACT|nr:class I SAM-dependent methyltransferase [Dyadobacter sediminis]TLU91804.1 hypothetical protein FEM55_13570 [Dyadobacter sediminis]GGC00129.1 hypothetical protein GCM10011325_29200 [Dyadobacter sediminis]